MITRRAGLEEQRLYEMAKLKAQFQELLTDVGLHRLGAVGVRPSGYEGGEAIFEEGSGTEKSVEGAGVWKYETGKVSTVLIGAVGCNWLGAMGLSPLREWGEGSTDK